MKQATKELISATTLGGTTVVKSPQIPLDQIWGYCVQALTAGSIFAGSYQIQGSCAPKDYVGTIPDAMWFSVGSAITVAAAGSVGTNVSDIAYQWMRVVWTPNSGTGTITFSVSFKGV